MPFARGRSVAPSLTLTIGLSTGPRAFSLALKLKNFTTALFAIDQLFIDCPFN
jgi:hypothetical protein